jgi:hypothetical protein
MWGAIDGLGFIFFGIVLQKNDQRGGCLSQALNLVVYEFNELLDLSSLSLAKH